MGLHMGANGGNGGFWEKWMWLSRRQRAIGVPDSAFI